jgi:hypothetical protein
MNFSEIVDHFCLKRLLLHVRFAVGPFRMFFYIIILTGISNFTIFNIVLTKNQKKW